MWQKLTLPNVDNKRRLPSSRRLNKTAGNPVRNTCDSGFVRSWLAIEANLSNSQKPRIRGRNMFSSEVHSTQAGSGMHIFVHNVSIIQWYICHKAQIPKKGFWLVVDISCRVALPQVLSASLGGKDLSPSMTWRLLKCVVRVHDEARI